jgi:hypothetical protein
VAQVARLVLRENDDLSRSPREPLEHQEEPTEGP